MSRKKKLHWRTTFGKIEVIEQTFLSLKHQNSHTAIFNFRQWFSVGSYSMRLQRVLTDFGADNRLARPQKKFVSITGLMFRQVQQDSKSKNMPKK